MKMSGRGKRKRRKHNTFKQHGQTLQNMPRECHKCRMGNVFNATGAGSEVSSSSRGTASASSKSREMDIPGFYYDPEKKRYFKIAPGHSGNKMTREAIAKKEAEAKRQTDIEKIFVKKPSKTEIATRRKKWCIRNVVPLLNKVCINDINCEGMKSKMFEASVSCLKPAGSQHMFDPHYLGIYDNIEHMQMMHVGRDYDELLGLWSLKETWVQRIQAIKLDECVRTGGQSSLSVVAKPHKKVIIQSLNKVTDLCWANLQNDRKHVLYTTICHTGYAYSLAMIRSIDLGEGDTATVQDYNLGKKATWACAWNTPKQVFSVGSEKCALILNVERRTMWEFNTHISDPLTQVFSQENSNYLFTGTRKGEILTHDLRSRSTYPVSYVSHLSSVCGLNVLQNGVHLVATDFTGKMCLWDMRKKSIVVNYSGNVNKYTKLPVHVDETERIVYTVGEDGYTRFWNLQQGGLLYTIPPPCSVTRETIPSVQLSFRWGNRQGNSGLIMALENKLYYYGSLGIS